MKNFLHDNPFLFYVIKFLGVFFACYSGTIAIIGLSVRGGYYSPLVHNYFDYVNWLRTSLLYGAKWLLSFFYHDVYVSGKYLLKVKNGSGVRMVYSCLGFGIMSFWIAFIVANKGAVKKKIQWILVGLLLIWFINILRISILLAATGNRWRIPYFNHHTWFNIFAYLLIFMLIYFYDRSFKKHSPGTAAKFFSRS